LEWRNAVSKTREDVLCTEARVALDIQDACNLKGVIYRLSCAREELSALGRDKGTDWFNNHPIMRLYASKIHSLTGMGLSDIDRFAEAYTLCERMAAGEDCY
jgi:hypothetical protein